MWNVLIHYVTTECSFNEETGQLLWSVLYRTGEKEEKHVEILVELKPTRRCWDICCLSAGLSFNTEAAGYAERSSSWGWTWRGGRVPSVKKCKKGKAKEERRSWMYIKSSVVGEKEGKKRQSETDERGTDVQKKEYLWMFYWFPWGTFSVPLAHFTARSDHRVGYRAASLKQVGFHCFPKT